VTAEVFSVLYLIAAVATLVGVIVYLAAMLDTRPDIVDGIGLGCVGLVAGVLWPLVVLGVIVMYGARRVWMVASSPPADG